jgi:AraC-like DNA-binding protein
MEITRIKSISQYCKMANIDKPEHPLIAVIDYSKVQYEPNESSLVFDYYCIGLKRNVISKIHYGQQEYDFDEGVMSFFAPGQVLRFQPLPQSAVRPTGYLLLIHPDFIWGTNLASTIKKYEFFNYSVNEALFLSDKEEKVLLSIIENIKREYHSNIDKFTQNIIITQIETLLSYAERFYQRQFITRKVSTHQVIEKIEAYLETYFNTESITLNSLPTVQMLATEANMSPVYLSNLLKELTGLSAQQHIHEKLIAKAKILLSTTKLSVSEIAYDLGFEHSQSFSKLFKSKVNQSPSEFRAAFN